MSYKIIILKISNKSIALGSAPRWSKYEIQFVLPQPDAIWIICAWRQVTDETDHINTKKLN